MTPRKKNLDIRQRLLDEGVATFVERGFHGAGLKEVLDRVEVPKGSFYNYFASKEAFGAEVIRHFADRVVSKLSKAMEEAETPLAGVRAFFEGLMDGFEHAGFRGGCLMANLGGELDDCELCRVALREAFHSLRDGLRGALERARDAGQVRSDIDPGEMADLLINHWEGAVIRMKVERSPAPLRQCLDRLLEGFFKP